MSGKLSNFVAGKTAAAQPQPQNLGRTREVIAAQSRVKSYGLPHQTRPATKQSHTAHPNPFALSESGESNERKAEVLVEDSQVEEHSHPLFNNDKYRQEAQEAQQRHFEGLYLDDDEVSQSGEDDDGQYGQDVVVGDQNMQEMGDIRVSREMQHALDMQRDAQLETFAAGPGSNYPTTTTGGPNDEERYEESSSQHEYQDEPNQHAERQYQPFQPLYAEQRDSGMHQPSHLRYQQLAPRVVNRTEQISQKMGYRLAAQPMILRQNLPGDRATPQQEHQRAPSKGINRTAYVSQQSQQASIAVKHRSITAMPVQTSSASVAQNANHAMSPQLDEEECLDYEGEKLKTINYDDLRYQSFDHDPSCVGAAIKKKIGLPEDELQIPLSDRLSLMREKEAGQQQAFFASLPVDEWEEAGDWFLEQFGEIMKQMRKQKRKLAKEFEDEVSKRHELVASRKQDIAEAMSSMQTNGQEVLRGSTPKKPKTPAVAGVGR
jgi:hypothetical protein